MSAAMIRNLQPLGGVKIYNLAIRTIVPATTMGSSSRKRPLGQEDSESTRPSKRARFSHETMKDNIGARPIHALPYRFKPALPISSPAPSTSTPAPSTTTTYTRAKAAGIPTSLKRKAQKSAGRKTTTMGRHFAIHQDAHDKHPSLLRTHSTHTLNISNDGGALNHHRGKENIPPADYSTPPRAHTNRLRTARAPLRNLSSNAQ